MEPMTRRPFGPLVTAMVMSAAFAACNGSDRFGSVSMEQASDEQQDGGISKPKDDDKGGPDSNLDDPAEQKSLCEPGKRRCVDDTPEECSDEGQWFATQAACATSCYDGQCGECVDSTKRCRSGAVEVCERGTWQVDAVCDGACEDLKCIDTCTEGRFQCNDKSLEVCENGQYASDTECEFLCDEGECAGECKPDARRCTPDSSSAAQTCNALGLWDESVECSAGTYCAEGECLPCQPGVPECAACEPSERACTGNTPRQCSEDGIWVNQAACSGVTPTCDPQTGECIAADNRFGSGIFGSARFAP